LISLLEGAYKAIRIQESVAGSQEEKIEIEQKVVFCKGLDTLPQNIVLRYTSRKCKNHPT